MLRIGISPHAVRGGRNWTRKSPPQGVVIAREFTDRSGDEIAEPPDLGLQLPCVIEQLEDLIELL